jgi:3'-phosphoadenosine 5'-phosphosulfate sulfotransferase (PAPS reductase)/FAD synthetase
MSVEPNIASYDVVLVNSSAGKDSQAMLDHVVSLADAAGVRDRIVVVHCDLGRVEWAGTRELAERQAKHYGLRFEVVSRPQGDLLTHIEQRGMWPDSARRYCTSDHKRGQVRKVLTKLTDEVRANRGAWRLSRPVRILNCLGLRAQESPSRRNCPACKGRGVTLPEGVKVTKVKLAKIRHTLPACGKCGGDGQRVSFEFDVKASNGRRHVDTWLPIHHWTTDTVWERIKASGVEHHRAYDLGMKRLSCVFCVFAPKAALLIAAKHNPDLLAEYVRVEDKIGHSFTEKFRLRVIQDEAKTADVDALAQTDDGCWNM